MKQIAIAALLLVGCAPLHLRREPAAPGAARALAPDPADCERLDDRVVGWTAAGIVVGVLAGGSGVASVLTDEVPRYVTGGVGIALSAGAALSSYLSTQYARRFVARCGATP